MSVFAQEPIASYQMSYFSSSSSTFNVNATSPDEKGEFDYYVDTHSLQREHSSVVLNIKRSKLQNFIKVIEEAKNTYIEWDSVAVANSVVDLEKTMKVKSPTMMCAFLYGGKWNFDYNVNLEFVFKHIDGKPVLIIRTNKLQSSSNQFIDSKGGALVFTSVEEINAFIAALDPGLVIEHYSSKNEKEDLFKD